MTNNKSLPQEVNVLFNAKQNRRKALAKLPFEEKITVLLKLQQISYDLRSAKSDAKYRVWKI